MAAIASRSLVRAMSRSQRLVVAGSAAAGWLSPANNDTARSGSPSRSAASASRSLGDIPVTRWNTMLSGRLIAVRIARRTFIVGRGAGSAAPASDGGRSDLGGPLGLALRGTLDMDADRLGRVALVDDGALLEEHRPIAVLGDPGHVVRDEDDPLGRRHALDHAGFRLLPQLGVP